MQSQNDRSGGPLLLANKSRGLGHSQVHTRRLDLTHRTDAARQLAFKAAQIVDTLHKLAGAKLLVFQQFKADITRLGQALSRQLQAGFVNLRLRHHDGGTTLGELGTVQEAKLKEAGVTAYNHNLDTSPEHYTNIVSTHTYQDRLNTLRHVQDAGMSVCSGGILGLGETTEDRLRMLEILSHFNPQPESVPINSLVPIPGTPLAEAQGVDSFEVVRMIALARIAIPKAKVRLSAGRKQMSEEMQALCFFAGANSIFYGDKLLTTGNPQSEADLNLLRKLGLQPQKPNRDLTAPEAESCRPLAPALA